MASSEPPLSLWSISIDGAAGAAPYEQTWINPTKLEMKLNAGEASYTVTLDLLATHANLCSTLAALARPFAGLNFPIT